MFGTAQGVRITQWMSLFQGCLLGRTPLYTYKVLIVDFYNLHIKTQTTNQQQCEHSRWPETNVGQQY